MGALYLYHGPREESGHAQAGQKSFRMKQGCGEGKGVHTLFLVIVLLGLRPKLNKCLF